MSKFEKGPNRARNKGQFRPGVSGNPGGKPKAIVEVAALCRQYTVEAVATLVSIALDKKATASARVSAANAVLFRAWGDPPPWLPAIKDDELMSRLLEVQCEDNRRLITNINEETKNGRNN
jgi:hypothetical protein